MKQKHLETTEEGVIFMHKDLTCKFRLSGTPIPI